MTTLAYMYSELNAHVHFIISHMQEILIDCFLLMQRPANYELLKNKFIARRRDVHGRKMNDD